ncbi:MAG: methionyl-tRNA formyltransferase [Lewinellaceae bacterium]|nr:methionyl-tRNA formyltransferase [Lewinellaceae bacterium]
MNKALRIVFMGTPDFAVPSLAGLLENNYNVVGVVTAPDKRGGRGRQQLLESAVKQFALSKGLAILQPTNLKDPDFLTELKSLGANLQIVVAFRMLPAAVWSYPELGTFNLHASLLPKYRGAAPINWAIINGEKETGVTTFFLQQEIDTGDVILRKTLPIGPEETAGELHDRLMALGATAVLETVQRIETGNANPVKQEDTKATKAPKIFHETCEIDFQQPLAQVFNFVRGLSPYPGAWTSLDGLTLKIFRATPLPDSEVKLAPGTFRSDNKTYIQVSTPDGYLQLDEIQLAGKRRMAAREFLNGFSFENL